MKGFSPRNLRYMRAFAEAWPDDLIVQQVVAQLPWGHNTILLDKLKASTQREWYARQTIQNGWSRGVMVHQIDTRLFERQGMAVTNFDRTLPPPQSELARQMLKDPYNFDFLSLGQEVQERDMERGLVERVRELLLELGVGFAFVGNQYHLEVGGQDFYLDLLFYHLRLRCYIVVELKATAFQPEYAGKMNFYPSAVDDLLRQSGNRVIAEYALRDMGKPMGVSAYRLAAALPEDFAGQLPSIEALEAKLNEEIDVGQE